MAGHVFISHAHQDRASAEQLLAALESRGIKCWSAPRDVAPGGSYAESILRGIEDSSCFVLVFTQHSNLSPHVLREVERALALGINIIPVRFDDSGVSKSLDYLLASTTSLQHLRADSDVEVLGEAQAFPIEEDGSLIPFGRVRTAAQ